MSEPKNEKIAGWVIAVAGLLIALYGAVIEVSAGIDGPDWGWLAAGIVLVLIGWLICRYGWFVITKR